MNLGVILQETARIHGGRTAVLDDERSFTWTEFADRVARAAGLLSQSGVVPGRRYGLLMRNSFHMAELMWAGYRMGAVPVPINWRLAPAEVIDILEDSGCALLALDPEFLPLLDKAGNGHWRSRALVVGTEDGSEYEKRLLSAPRAALHAVDEHAEAIMIYTGGTTGRSKGVRLSHRNVIWNSLQVGLALGVRESDVTLHVAPMFHAADLCCNVAMFLGGAQAFLRQFSPLTMLAAIQRHRVSYTVAVPAMLKMILDEPKTSDFDTASLRLVFYGSSPMPAEWIRGVFSRFPRTEFHQAYGLTETSPILTILSHAEHVRGVERGETAVLSSAGRPLVGVQMRIVDEQGQELPAGEAGEVAVRGPSVMLGYHDRPEETAAALRNGWLRTGDIGRFDAEGRLHLLDRKKDMVISGGENIYSVEVESVLCRHPGVSEASVIGVPDPVLGEALLAVVAPRRGSAPTAEDLVAHCRAHIGSYKVPRRFAFVEALPRSLVGKVLKGVLRERYKNAR
jgi:long-chain acyl-CoA synthetase